jgi:hypothetical protein
VRLAALTAILLLGLAAPAASAATLEPVGDFERPIFVSSHPDDPDRLLVVEREGRVVEVGAGVLADISALVSCCEGERGLLSIAPAPDFAGSGRFFAAYTGNTAAGGEVGDIHVDAFRREGEVLVREQLLSIGHAATTHNGGQLQLGPDGDLYLSTGDGGGAGDPLGSGQSLATLLGKIVRIDPDAGSAEIWSYGLRNPWRFSFDRLSGDMAIADVGQGAREEVNLALSPSPGSVGGAGVNYGWNCREGSIAYPGAPESCDGAGGFTDPIFDYPHTDPGGGDAHGCSITGGYVARDPSLGDLYGRYLYADFCVGEIRSLQLPTGPGGLATGDRSEGLAVANPVSFGEDSCGRLYVVSNGGEVFRIAGSEPATCSATGPPLSPAPAPPPPSGALPSPPSLAGPAARPRPRIRLRGRTRPVSGGGVSLILTVRVSPCPGRDGALVRLRRGGQPAGSQPLSQGCVTRFFRRIAWRRSTFRVLLGSERYRSQVLTIALAKPRP